LAIGIGVGIFASFIYGLFGGLVFGLAGGRASVATLRWSWPAVRYGLTVALVSGLFGAFLGLLFGSMLNEKGMVAGGVLMGFMFGLTFGLVGGLVSGLAGYRDSAASLRWSWWALFRPADGSADTFTGFGDYFTAELNKWSWSRWSWRRASYGIIVISA
jgi:hypothetical protein